MIVDVPTQHDTYIGLLDMPVDVSGSCDAVDVGSKQGKEPGEASSAHCLMSMAKLMTHNTMLVTLSTIPSVAAIVVIRVSDND